MSREEWIEKERKRQRVRVQPTSDLAADIPPSLGLDIEKINALPESAEDYADFMEITGRKVPLWKQTWLAHPLKYNPLFGEKRPHAYKTTLPAYPWANQEDYSRYIRRLLNDIFVNSEIMPTKHEDL